MDIFVMTTDNVINTHGITFNLAYRQLDSWEQISVKIESEFYHFHTKNAFENVVCQNGGHFV